MSKILVTGSGNIRSIVVDIQRCSDIARNGSMAFDLITSNRRNGKRKPKPWDSPYPQ